MLLKDAITRAPCLRLPSAMRAAAVKRWVESPDNYLKVEVSFVDVLDVCYCKAVRA